ncbi:MAG: hypothetical protein GX234_08330 [Clostridiales bacterium]|nr:hypothetical protein [Clostridiales bacterium]
MKLKYYLRGLGIGIVVTALVLGLSGKKESLTDEEIKERAAGLGMIENTVLSEMEVESMEEENTKEAENEAEPESEAVEPEMESESSLETEPESALETENDTLTESSVEDQGMPDEKGIPEEQTEETETESEMIRETVNIIVQSGDTSWPVAKRVHAAGLVSDAAAFDDFMCDNGYSRYLRAGSYEIPVGADEKEIAEILAGRDKK